jgi:hypothetical protein
MRIEKGGVWNLMTSVGLKSDTPIGANGGDISGGIALESPYLVLIFDILIEE